jgi:hypothetical protein
MVKKVNVSFAGRVCGQKVNFSLLKGGVKKGSFSMSGKRHGKKTQFQHAWKRLY